MIKLASVFANKENQSDTVGRGSRDNPEGMRGPPCPNMDK